MLRGNYQARVDDKGRVKIPAAFLEDLREYGNKFYVTSESGEFARVYPMKAWNAIEAKLEKLPSYNRAKQKFLTQTNYYGQVIELDGQGEIGDGLVQLTLFEIGQTAIGVARGAYGIEPEGLIKVIDRQVEFIFFEMSVTIDLVGGHLAGIDIAGLHQNHRDHDRRNENDGKQDFPHVDFHKVVF